MTEDEKTQARLLYDPIEQAKLSVEKPAPAPRVPDPPPAPTKQVRRKAAKSDTTLASTLGPDDDTKPMRLPVAVNERPKYLRAKRDQVVMYKKALLTVKAGRLFSSFQYDFAALRHVLDVEDVTE